MHWKLIQVLAVLLRYINFDLTKNNVLLEDTFHVTSSPHHGIIPCFFSNQKSFTFLLRWTIIIINFPQKLQEITLMIRVWWQRTRHLTQKILRLCWWDKEALQIRVGIEKRIETQLLVIKLWFLFWHLGGMLLWRNGFLGKLNLNKSVVLCLPFFLSYFNDFSKWKCCKSFEKSLKYATNLTKFKHVFLKAIFFSSH